jgi:hypothetical protein
MKIPTIVLLCLITLLMGCSVLPNRTSSSLWQERKMEDNRRIHGNPYESTTQLQSIWLPTPY